MADPPVAGPVAFVGLGLIGGSIARDLRIASPSTELVAWTPSGASPRAALARGVIDRATDSVTAAVAGAELVVLAGPPLAIIELIDEHAESLRAAAGAGATVTDVASTKAAVVAAADRAGLPFVGGHPMAGRESSGFEAADVGLFRERPWVIVRGASARPTDVERVERLARVVGAHPTWLEAAAHDAAVAAISHLPLVAAAALVEAATAAEDWPTARGLAASGWAGMTRLARGDPAMGAGILATNPDATLERLRAYRDAIDAWISLLAERSAGSAAGSDRLRARLEGARAALAEVTDG